MLKRLPIDTNIYIDINKIELPRDTGIQVKRSVDMTSSGMNGLDIRANVSPKWDKNRCPAE